MKIKELNNFKEVSEELLRRVKSEIEVLKFKRWDFDSTLFKNEFYFKYGDIFIDVRHYDIKDINNIQNYVFQLASMDEDENVIDKYNLFFTVQASGICELPKIEIAEIKHIEEQIIPAHDIINFKEV